MTTDATSDSFEIPAGHTGHEIVFPLGRRSEQAAATAAEAEGAARMAEPCRGCFAHGTCQVARLLQLADRQMPVTDRQTPTRWLYTRSLARGEHVFYAGDEQEAVYVVKSGSVKTWLTSASGPEPVLGFHLAGDMLGFEALGTRVQSCSATALENSVVCVLPLLQFEALINRTRGAFRWFLDVTGRIFADHQAAFAMLGRTRAEVRLGCFLLDLSRRYRERGFSGRQFNLPMSRQDISKHLGLAQETLSRLMAHLEQDGVISAERRRITILNPLALERLARQSGARVDRLNYAPDKRKSA